MLAWEKVDLNTVHESKENPIIDRINENSLKRHYVSAKNMDKCGLVFSFGIM